MAESSDSDEETGPPAVAAIDLVTPAWSVVPTPVHTPRPSTVELIASNSTVTRKRVLDDVSISMNRYLMMHTLIQRRVTQPNPLLQQPWERPSFISNACSSLFKRPVVTVDMPVLYDEATSSTAVPTRPRLTYAASILCKQANPESEDMLRRRALIRWRVIVESDVSAFDVGIQAEAEINSGHIIYNLSDVLNDIFSSKSASTLIKRSGDLLKYSNWCMSNGIHCPWRLQESVVYTYIRDLKDNAAPSTASSFLSALRFSQHTIGLRAVPNVLTSRVKGASDSLLSNRKTTKQAKPLTAFQVYKLERVAVTHPDDKIKFIAGYLCFCLYSCARFKDAMYAESWVLDMPSDNFGFIEARTRKHKTASLKIATMLPLVGFARGLYTQAWGKVWFKMRDDLEKEMDDGFSVPCVLPAVLRNNTWAPRPMTTSEGSIFLREILRNEGEVVDGISTHSLKATLLSWASKDNMSIEDRRLLGHHVDRNQISPLTYSRDALAGPLNSLWSVICRVRSGRFDPDESRAVRTMRILAIPGAPDLNTLEESNPFDCTEIPPPIEELPSSIFDPVATAEGPELEACSSDSDSQDKDSESDISEIMDCESEDATLSTLRFVAENPAAEDNLYVHKESGLGHLLKDEEGLRFTCGKFLSPSYKKATVHSAAISMCLRCRPL